MNSSESLFGVNDSLVIKQESILGDGISMCSSERKEPIEDKHLSEEEICKKCDENNDKIGTLNENSKFPKQKFVILKNIRLADLQQNFQQGQFFNITQASSNLSASTVCPNCDKVLISKEAFQSHLKVCKQFTHYLCDKCSFVTWNKFLLKHHNESAHVPKECPKCSLIYDNDKSFISHYHECSKLQSKTYSCKKCSYQCKEMSMLQFHIKLMHSDSLKSIRIEKSILPPKKPKDLTNQDKFQEFIKNKNEQKIIMLVSAKSLYSKMYDNVAEPNDISNSLPLEDQSNSVKPHNIINSLSSEDKNDITGDNVVDSLFSKDHENDYYEVDHVAPSNDISNPSPLKAQSNSMEPDNIGNFLTFKDKNNITGDIVVNSLFSNNQNKDYYEVEKMIAEIVKQQNKQNDKNKAGAKVTKICRVCNITTEFDIADKCKICNRRSIFRCNQCSRYFENYQTVSYHLWTQCNLKGHYHCLKCNFKSPYKFKVRYHCDKHHPEIFDSLRSVKETEYIKFKAFQSNTQESQNSALDLTIYDLHFSSDSSINTVEPKNVLRFIVQHCIKCNKDIELEFHEFRFIKTCDTCKNFMFFKCTKCDKLCRNYESLSQHSKNYCCSQELLKCTKCDYTTYRISRLSEHYQNIHTGFSGVCQHCEKIFTNTINYKKHLTHCIIPLRFTCEDCPFKTKSKGNLRKHILSHHLNISPVYTGSCTTYSDLRTCLKTYCTNCCVRSSVAFCVKKCRKCKEILNFECQICHKTFKSDDIEACKHIKTYLRLLKFECHCCGKGFYTKEKLDIHMSSYCTISRPFKCQFCSYGSSIKRDVRKHEQQVHPTEIKNCFGRNLHKNKIYQCNVCSYKCGGRIGYVMKHILRCHVEGKNKSRLPPCARCSWDFKSSFGLREHLSYCGKKLYMKCRVNLTRMRMEPVNSSQELPMTIKEESIDLNEFEMKSEK